MDSGSGRSDPRPMKENEEAVKQNTDCVYFLASPLTCKKGSECEYRHREGARLNPRDCRFWLSGNCLNPKCLFRHPPLDGMVGSPGATSGPIGASSQVSPSAQLPMENSSPYNLSRNNVPCYYFLKGACLKGDKCPFMHGPLSAGNPVAKKVAKVSARVTTQLEIPENDAWKVRECNNQQKLPTALNIGKDSADKLVNGATSSGKDNRTVENANSHLVNKSSALLVRSRNGLPISQTTYDPARSCDSYSLPGNLHVHPDRNLLHGKEVGEILEEPSEVGYPELERPLNQLKSPSDHYQNGQAAEEVFRDSSPGFDVLVDHVVRDDEYSHETDGFRSGSSQGRRNANLGDDYGNHHLDYESSTRLDRYRSNGAGEFQHYDKVQNRGDWDQQRTSSAFERILDKPLLTERRSTQSLMSPEEMDASDLRHRLMKQRRKDGYFSAISYGHYDEPYIKHDQNIQDSYPAHNTYRDKRNLHESTISSRLRGRITLPNPPFPEIPSYLQDERDRGRQHVKLPHVRPSGNHGSLGERLGWRPIEESSANARYLGSQQKTRDGVDLLDFAGPRSLAELKGVKADGNSQDQSTKNNHSTSSLEHNRMGSLKAAGLRESVEFEGPKPLSVLLKRKREVGFENDAISGVNNDRKVILESEVGLCVSAPAPAFETNLEEIKAVVNSLEEPKVGTAEEDLIPSEDEQISYEQQATGDEKETKDAAEDEEPDYTDQRDGEYVYDTVEGGDYKTEEHGMDQMDVDVDADEDEDDFAKKIDLIFS